MRPREKNKGLISHTAEIILLNVFNHIFLKTSVKIISPDIKIAERLNFNICQNYS
jgi:hypothetical protein